MIKSPIQKVTNKLQYRAIGIVNGIYSPHDQDQINKGFLIDNQENINKLKNTAINSLINLKIKYLEVKRNKINKIDEKRLKKYLDNLSKKYGTNGKNLNKIFIQNNIDYDLFLEEITTEFKWQQFILSSYKKELMSERKNLNTEVENELKDILTKKGNLVEYELLCYEFKRFHKRDT